MFKQKTVALVAATLAGLLAQGAASAASINDNAALAGAKVVTFDLFDGLFPHLVPQAATQIGAEVGELVSLVTSTDIEIGANNRNLDENGMWGARGNPDSGLTATPTGSGNFVAIADGELRYTFINGVDGVGAFLNQNRAFGDSRSLTLVAYDQAGVVLETFNASISTAWDSENQGQFLGFKRASADIYGFGVIGQDVVMDNLSFTAAVPEASTYAMLLAGLGALGFVARRRKNA